MGIYNSDNKPVRAAEQDCLALLSEFFCGGCKATRNGWIGLELRDASRDGRGNRVARIVVLPVLIAKKGAFGS
jgi:hypothetical protein